MLFDCFEQVEKLFDNLSFTDVVSNLRKQCSGDLNKVLSLCRSTLNLNAKNTLMVRSYYKYAFLVTLSCVQVRVMEELRQLPFQSSVPRPILPVGLPIKAEVNIRNLKLRLKDVAKLRQQVCASDHVFCVKGSQ